jgi:competence protein ComEC
MGAWSVLHPESTDRFGQADDNALVLRAQFFGTRVLLLSDLGRLGQNALLERAPDLRAEIVVTGLPTATESLRDELLNAIQPRVIVVADSEYPAAERASPALKKRLERHGVPVLYARSTGALTVEFDRRGYVIRSTRGVEFAGTPCAVNRGPPPGRQAE